MHHRSVAALSFASAVVAQQAGTVTTETHPSLPIQSCTAAGSCTSVASKVTLDANWRWVHTNTGYTNCYTGDAWDTSICPDGVTCAKACSLDGADYANTYGITTPSSGSLKLNFVTNNANGKNVGSRVYLMDTDSSYMTFNLLNKEFTFDVDVSNLPCGLNGAVYFSQMAKDGGTSEYPDNKAGAKFGTGYCDSQCPHDIKFINGEANVAGWDGTGANTGAGATVDTTRPFTVVTQFITADGTAAGALVEIRRFYVQGGRLIPNSASSVAGVTPSGSITDGFCAQQKAAFGDPNDFKAKGGLAKMGESLEDMVLVLSLWDDTSVSMNWLDSTYPVGSSGPGVVRGTCDPAAGVAATVEGAHPGASVTYSNIKVGALNSTFTA